MARTRRGNTAVTTEVRRAVNIGKADTHGPTAVALQYSHDCNVPWCLLDVVSVVSKVTRRQAAKVVTVTDRLTA